MGGWEAGVGYSLVPQQSLNASACGYSQPVSLEHNTTLGLHYPTILYHTYTQGQEHINRNRQGYIWPANCG